MTTGANYTLPDFTVSESPPHDSIADLTRCDPDCSASDSHRILCTARWGAHWPGDPLPEHEPPPFDPDCHPAATAVARRDRRQLPTASKCAEPRKEEEAPPRFDLPFLVTPAYSYIFAAFCEED